MNVVNKNTDGIITVKEFIYAADNGLDVWVTLSHFNPMDKNKNINHKVKPEKAKVPKSWYLGNIDIGFSTDVQPDDEVNYDYDDCSLIVYRLKNINYENSSDS